MKIYHIERNYKLPLKEQKWINIGLSYAFATNPPCVPSPLTLEWITTLLTLFSKWQPV